MIPPTVIPELRPRAPTAPAAGRAAAPVRPADSLPAQWPGLGENDAVALAIRAIDAGEDELVERLGVAAGDRKDTVALHGLRSASLAEEVALAMGLTRETASRIRRAAILHDIGKLAVPASVLFKPGPLDPDEMALSKMHTVIGADLLRAGDSPLLPLACMLAMRHHEHWDGRGYPDGLAGEAIPLPARILSVADVFDALISARVYKVAWCEREALQEIVRQRGGHHDPAAVDALLRVYGRTDLDDWDQVVA